MKNSTDRLDVLLNNAGGIYLGRQETVDGYEMTFAVNHLAYFLLTNLLLDLIKSSAAGEDRQRGLGRASGLYHQVRRPPGKGSLQRLAGLSAIEARQHPLHPRARPAARGDGRDRQRAPSRLREDPDLPRRRRPRLAPPPRADLFAITPEQGAKTSVYLASSPEVEGVTGKYFARQKPVNTSAAAQDDAAARRLWEVSLELTGLKASPVG